jgi:hypothetical protein
MYMNVDNDGQKTGETDIAIVEEPFMYYQYNTVMTRKIELSDS